MIQCDCETSKGKQYVKCEKEAKYQNSWGWNFCPIHKGFGDKRIRPTSFLGAALSSHAADFNDSAIGEDELSNPNEESRVQY